MTGGNPEVAAGGVLPTSRELGLDEGDSLGGAGTWYKYG